MTFRQLRVWIHCETHPWHDKNIKSNAPYRWVLRTQLDHLVSLAKWLSVHLWIKWFWVRVQLQSLKLEILHLLWARSSLTFRQLYCGFTLKRLNDMTRTYSQFQACLFFYKKNLRAQKAAKHKTSDFHPYRKLCTRKIVPLVVKCLLNFVLLVNVCLWVFLCVWNIFVRQKNKQVWNCLDNLILLYYWRVPLSIRLSRIYLLTLTFICDYLWLFFKFLWK